jgi:hypothetical protein
MHVAYLDVKGVGDIIEFKSSCKGKGKGKPIRLQALTGPEVSRRWRLPDFKTTIT